MFFHFNLFLFALQDRLDYRSKINILTSKKVVCMRVNLFVSLALRVLEVNTYCSSRNRM